MATAAAYQKKLALLHPVESDDQTPRLCRNFILLVENTVSGHSGTIPLVSRLLRFPLKNRLETPVPAGIEFLQGLIQ